MARHGSGAPDPVTLPTRLRTVGAVDAQPPDIASSRPYLRFVPWWDPSTALDGHRPSGSYVETFWTPVLGPASVVAIRWANSMFERHPGGFELTLEEFAARIGLGARKGRNSPARRCLQRLDYFGLASDGDRVAVRTHVPDLPAHLQRRLPPALRAELRSGGRRPTPSG